MLIIGIAGGTGSGKTTVVQKIIESFQKMKLLYFHRIHTTLITVT
jgi:uridine kinase